MQSKNNFSYICIFILSVVSALFVFHILYTYNNKYTCNIQQPMNGILYLDNKELLNDNVYYLINDWEYYENCLLEPNDFKNGSPDIYTQYTSIGEKTALGRHTPFGSGTYSLTLSLPEEENTYGLYIPEIYSAYDLYVNDDLVMQVGNIYNYEPYIQGKTAVFKASGITRIIIAVSDYTGVYSGMVYPPALGDINAINRVNDKRLFINSLIFSFSLLLFIASAFIALADKNKSTVIFSLLCFCAMTAVCYPLIHTLFGITSTLWQGIELLFSYIIYTLILLLQNILCKINKKITLLVFIISVIMCILAFLYASLTPLHTISIRIYFSYIVEFFKWATVIYLFLTLLYGTYKGVFNICPLVFGSAFFTISIAADRIFPLYEPIYCGWFPEIGCTVMILSLCYVYFANISKSYHMNIVLEAENKQMEKRIEIQKESYNQISEQMNNTKRLRHDMKQHIYVMESFLNKGEYKNLSDYLSSYKSSFDVLETEIFCNNPTINALLHYYCVCAKKNSIKFKVSVSANKDIPVCDTDLSIIFGNLIENALEACARQSQSKKAISIYGTADENKLMFCIKNTFDKNILLKEGKFLSSKRDDYGIGIESVKKVIKKYNGVIDINYNNVEFKVSVGIFY